MNKWMESKIKEANELAEKINTEFEYFLDSEVLIDEEREIVNVIVTDNETMKKAVISKSDRYGFLFSSMRRLNTYGRPQFEESKPKVMRTKLTLKGIKSWIDYINRELDFYQAQEDFFKMNLSKLEEVVSQLESEVQKIVATDRAVFQVRQGIFRIDLNLYSSGNAYVDFNIAHRRELKDYRDILKFEKAMKAFQDVMNG